MSEQYSQASDSDLVALALSGNERAFEELFERHYQMAYRCAFRLTGSKHDAEEIAQECFIRVAKSLHTFRYSARFTTWLYRIVMNAASDHRARLRKSEAIRSVETENAREKIQEAFGPNGVSAAVENALSRLSPRQRQVVVMLIFEDRTQQEAAAALACSVSAISWHFFQAKRRLRAALGGGHE